MKKIVMTMAAFLSISMAMAQNNDKCKGDDKCDDKQKCECKHQKQPTPEAMTDRMAEELKLTDAQKTKVLALNKEYQDIFKGPKMGGHRHHPKPKADAETGATQQKKEKLGRPELTDEQKANMKAQKAKREEYDKKLKGILTDDQYKQYKEKRKHGHHGPGGHHGHHGDHPGHGPRPFMGD